MDGTCEGDSPHLFCGLDGISGLVLDTIKIPSEKKELLVPFFQRIKKQYGELVALVHDMGRGIVAAVEEVFPKVEDFIFHFHFYATSEKICCWMNIQLFRSGCNNFKVGSLLRQRAKYLEQKIDADARNLDMIIVFWVSSRASPCRKIFLGSRRYRALRLTELFRLGLPVDNLFVC